MILKAALLFRGPSGLFRHDRGMMLDNFPTFTVLAIDKCEAAQKLLWRAVHSQIKCIDAGIDGQCIKQADVLVYDPAIGLLFQKAVEIILNGRGGLADFIRDSWQEHCIFGIKCGDRCGIAALERRVPVIKQVCDFVALGK